MVLSDVTKDPLQVARSHGGANVIEDEAADSDFALRRVEWKRPENQAKAGRRTAWQSTGA
jgi:hypothetical protein